jgi:DNA-binding NarL/FixJ family response regulator
MKKTIMTARQPAPRSVLYVEDHYLYRTSIPRMLTAFEVTAAATSKEAVQKARTRHFDAAVLDIDIPEQLSDLRASHERRWLGFQLARQLIRIHPKIAIVFFSGYNDCRRQVEQLIAERNEQGAVGYLLKGTNTPDESALNAALTITLNGKNHFSSDIPPAPDFCPAGKALLAALGEAERALIVQGYERIPALTDKQYATWKACATTPSQDEAARKRSVSLNTIETHMKEVYSNFFSGTELQGSTQKQKYAYLIWQLHNLQTSHENDAFLAPE